HGPAGAAVRTLVTAKVLFLASARSFRGREMIACGFRHRPGAGVSGSILAALATGPMQPAQTTGGIAMAANDRNGPQSRRRRPLGARSLTSSQHPQRAGL